MPVIESTPVVVFVHDRPVAPPRPNARRRINLSRLVLLGAVALFVLAGSLMIPMVGLQHDELLFADSVMRPDYTFWHVSSGRFTVPLMMNSYLGALKGWLFAPVFAAFGYGVGTIRIPALLLGAAIILLVYRLLREIAGASAGLIGAWLLATDVTFLLTTAFDWGPVALQNLLLTSMLLFLVLWRKKRQDWMLFAAGLACGLALWDKALFLWNLSSMAAMFAVLQSRFLLDRANIRRALPLLLGVVIGAAPLICFNIHDDGATLKSNAHFSTKELKPKFGQKLTSRTQFCDRLTEWVPQLTRELDPLELNTLLWVVLPWL